MISEYQKFLQGDAFLSNDPQVLLVKGHCQHVIKQANRQVDSIASGLLRKLIKLGNSSHIVTPIHIDFGRNLVIGEECIINANCTFLDIGKIIIHDKVLIGPNVQFLAGGHHTDALQRFNDRLTVIPKPITVHQNVWIGGGAIILGGVTIGEHSIVGAGSVVTKSVPPNCTVAGNPAKIISMQSTIA